VALGLLVAWPVAPAAPAHGSDQPAQAGVTYHVRADGGDPTRCTGLVDAPDPGVGEAQPCAWDHPFRALPPGAEPRISGGDTLIVHGGSYRMGYASPGAEACDAEASFGCLMSAIPSGPDPDHPTRIVGAGWDTGCDDPPELWGSERPWFVVNLTDSSHVELACFEITDHSSCVESHSGGLACERDRPPYGDWAPVGLHAEDSADVYLHDLDIHGLASTGVHAGRLRDWTVEDVRIAGNGSAGWDGDLWDDGEDANSGTLRFRRWTVEWNGCGETYPGGRPTGCWAQEAGGYGDGVGTGATGGDWIIEDSAFLHNTSDGLDLLYHSLGGRIVLSRVRAEGNAGNQIKLTGAAELLNVVVVGDCASFEGRPFTYLVDHCRANGNALSFFFMGGEAVSLRHVTLYGQGDGLIAAGPREGGACDGTERLVARDSVFVGDRDHFDPGDITFLFYQEDCAGLRLDSDFNVIERVKDVECGSTTDFVDSGAHDLCTGARLAGPMSGRTYGMSLGRQSPAIDSADDRRCPPVDVTGLDRPRDGDGDGSAECDRGAYELSERRS
jgi:hypothetical protein